MLACIYVWYKVLVHKTVQPQSKVRRQFLFSRGPAKDLSVWTVPHLTPFLSHWPSIKLPWNISNYHIYRQSFADPRENKNCRRTFDCGCTINSKMLDVALTSLTFSRPHIKRKEKGRKNGRNGIMRVLRREGGRRVWGRCEGGRIIGWRKLLNWIGISVTEGSRTSRTGSKGEEEAKNKVSLGI